jgi:hypothetical protein
MRRQNVLGFTAVTAFAFLIGHGIAAAQAQNGPQQVPDATAGVTHQVNLSPAEQLAQTDGFLARMDGSRSVVRHQLETARAQRDVVKTLCLNDKLNQIDVAIRSARERRQSLEAAASRNDVDLSNHEFTILSVLRQRTDQLAAEANQCIGKEAGFVGESAVTSSIDPNLPDDPSKYPGTQPGQYPDDNLFVDPPACASCFQ